MGKRSDFPKIERNFYQTWDPKAVAPLLPHLKPHTKYAEPCAGQLALVKQLDEAGHTLYWGSDIEGQEATTTFFGVPVTRKVPAMDALKLTTPLQMADCIITNPPWDWSILHKMIEHFIANSKYTWLLLDADLMHNKRMAPYIDYCSDIVAIGRVRWIPNTKDGGKQNCCWYRFEKESVSTIFHPRMITPVASKAS